MRVLRVADVRNVRTEGMQRVMHGTADVLRARGHTVDFLFRDRLPAPGPEKLRRLAVPFRVPLIVRELARKGEKYDVLEVHEPLAAVCCSLRKRVKWIPPVVIYSYGLEEVGLKVLLEYRRRKGLPVSLKTRWSPLTVILQAKYAVRHADHVVCSNVADVRYLERVGVQAGALTEVPGGVAEEFFHAEPNWNRDPGGILFVGTWIMRKGVLHLVPALTSVLRANARASVTVAGCAVPRESVLGSFPEDVRGRVEVVPHIGSNRELIDCYRRHAVFVLPSLFEGYPLSMLEAASLGLALVTSDACGMAEFVEDGKNGWKVPVGDAEALAAVLLRAVADDAGTRRLGEAARQKAQGFSWEHAGGALLAAYERALGRG